MNIDKNSKHIDPNFSIQKILNYVSLFIKFHFLHLYSLNVVLAYAYPFQISYQGAIGLPSSCQIKMNQVRTAYYIRCFMQCNSSVNIEKRNHSVYEWKTPGHSIHYNKGGRKKPYNNDVLNTKPIGYTDIYRKMYRINTRICIKISAHDQGHRISIKMLEFSKF